MSVWKQIQNNRWGGGILTLVFFTHYKNIIKNELETRLNRVPSSKEINWCFWDYLGFKFKFNGSIDVDYFGTQLYLKSDFVRKDSFAQFKRNKWRDKLSDKKYIKLFDDKSWLYKEFKEYLHRDWKLIDKNTTYEEYSDFMKNKTAVFVKEPKGCGGKGVKLYITDSEEKKTELYNILIKNQYIVEDPIKQCKELHCFSDYKAVNTLRIVTIIDEKGMPHAVSAAFRMGAGNSSVDNFSSGGMVAPIDIETGIISNCATDKAGHKYLIHPSSKKQIIGFKVPDWEEYKNFALKLALKFPTMRYAGWDIVKDTDGNYIMIEGNREAGADVMECSLLYGLFPVYNTYLKMN